MKYQVLYASIPAQALVVEEVEADEYAHNGGFVDFWKEGRRISSYGGVVYVKEVESSPPQV